MSLVLGVFDRLSGLARVMGVDYLRFRALLETQLKLDLRRVNNPGQQGFQKSPLLISLLFLVVGFFGAGGLLLDSPILGMGVSLSFISVVTIILIVSDHVATLFDSTDASIAGPQPVDDRTFFAARAAHISVFLARTAGLLGLGSLIVGSAVYPAWIFIPIYLLSLLLTCALCLVAAFGLILLLIRVIGHDRARNIIVFVQIGVTVLFIGGAQLAPRLIDMDALGSYLDLQSWYLTLVPPCYFGGLLAVATGSYDSLSLCLAGLAFLVPLLLTLFVVRLATRGFMANIAALAITRDKPRRDPRLRRHWYDRFTKDPVRRAGFEFFRSLSRRETQYRLRAYPSLVISFIMGGVVSIGFGGFDPRMLCGALYMLAVSVPAMIVPGRFSETPDARWVLIAAPDFHEGRFNSGAVQAHLFTLHFPAMLCAALITLAIGGVSVLPDVIYALCATLLISLIGARLCGNRVPFTAAPPKQATTEFVGESLLIMGITIAVAAIHVCANAFGPSISLYVLSVAILPVCGVLARALRDLPPPQPLR